MTPEECDAQLSSDSQRVEGRELITRITTIALASVKRETPVKRGTLRRSETYEIDSPQQGHIGTNLKYARAVHEGLPPRVITPVHKAALFWPGAAHPVKKVNHPGTKGNPFFTRGINHARPGIDRELEDFGDDLSDGGH